MWRALALAVLGLALVAGAQAQGPELGGTYHWFAQSEGGLVELRASGSGYVGILKAKPRYCPYQAGQQIFTFTSRDTTDSGYVGTALVPSSIPRRVGWDATCTLATTSAKLIVSSSGPSVFWYVGTTSISTPLLRAAGTVPTTTTPTTKTPATRDVKVTAVTGDVEVIRADGTTQVLTSGTEVGRNDRIVTGMDSAVRLVFRDGSVVDVKELTDFKVIELTNTGDTVRTRLWLKAGQVSAEVNPNRSGSSDFSVKTPTATCSVRGTLFTLFADPIGRIEVFSLKRGLVEVDPVSRTLPKVKVTAGREIGIVGGRMYQGAAGRAITIAGLSPAQAVARVSDRVAKAVAACGLKPVPANAFSLRVYGSLGWEVSLRLRGTGGGTATWTVTKAGVAPRNALASKITAGCSGGSAGGGCTLAGTWVQNTPGVGTSTWRTTGTGSAAESGLGNGTGKATLTGSTLRVDWTTADGWAGYYQWTLDGSCGGSGQLVFTAGPRKGQTVPSTVRRTA